MTRKHFEAIAECVRLARLKPGDRQHIASALSLVCAHFNPQFEPARFVEACTPSVETKLREGDV